jgi:PAS domain S-box-containing protein
MADPAPLDGSDTGLGPQPLQELAQTLVDLVAARAALITLWHTERGQLLPPVGAGPAPPDLDHLAATLTTAAPDLLQALTGARPAAARVGVLPGWELDASRREARLATRWGVMHVLAAPVDGAVALLGVVHAAPLRDVWAARPHVLRIILRQIQLALQLRQAQTRLREQGRWLDALLAGSLDGLVLVDSAGQVITCNPAFTRITGWDAADIAGRDLVEALDARPMRWSAGEGDDPRWDGLLRAADPDATIELALVGRGGAAIYSEAHVRPVAGDGGRLGALVTLRDVSAAREAEEAQATFLSVVSHELQTPLAVIRGFAELLADSAETMPRDQIRRKLAVVAEESERLSKMVADLLDASRIGSGGLELRREPVDIPGLVRRAVARVQMLSPRHQFVIALPDDLPPVLADYARVEQVLLNLLENAVKYSPGGGRITITSDLFSDEVILHVSDEGIGVPEAERERIFSRFARLNSRAVRQMKGVGLGLYIARAIVRAHGGRIWVDAAPGGGAQFSFSLPRQHKAPLPVLFGRS